MELNWKVRHRCDCMRNRCEDIPDYRSARTWWAPSPAPEDLFGKEVLIKALACLQGFFVDLWPGIVQVRRRYHCMMDWNLDESSYMKARNMRTTQFQPKKGAVLIAAKGSPKNTAHSYLLLSPGQSKGIKHMVRSQYLNCSDCHLAIKLCLIKLVIWLWRKAMKSLQPICTCKRSLHFFVLPS